MGWSAQKEQFAVNGPGSCDPVNGGFYYDTPITNGQTPSRIILCPQSCQLIDDAVDNPWSRCSPPARTR